MNRAELIDALATETGFTKASCEEWLSTFTNVVSKNITKKDGVKLVGFGTFNAKDRAARKGRNPQTGAEIQIAASTVPSFRPGRGFKEAVNR